jgi:hypothetical protein
VSLVAGDRWLRKCTLDSGACITVWLCSRHYGLMTTQTMFCTHEPLFHLFLASEESNIVEQMFFVHDTFVKYLLWKKCCRKYWNTAVSSKSVIYKLVAKLHATGLVPGKKKTKKKSLFWPKKNWERQLLV